MGHTSTPPPHYQKIFTVLHFYFHAFIIEINNTCQFKELSLLTKCSINQCVFDECVHKVRDLHGNGVGVGG